LARWLEQSFKGFVLAEVLGSNPPDSIFGSGYNMFSRGLNPSLSLAVCLLMSANDYIDLAWSARFGGPANSFFLNKICSRANIGHSRDATCHPLVGPRGAC
jgi:hypothetical protein